MWTRLCSTRARASPGQRDNEFTSHERLFLLLIPAQGEPVAVVPMLEENNWRHAVPSVTNIHLWDDKDGPLDAARKATASLGTPATVAIEPLGLRYMEYSILSDLIRTEFVSADPVVAALRMVKDQEEADSIRQAARIAETALAAVLQGVNPGVRERDVAAQLSSRLLGDGGGEISFGPIVLSGPKSALPHGIPDDREIGAGEFLLIDFGTSYNGYHCDITRTFVVGGEPTALMREVYEAVLAGNRAGCKATRAGASSHDVHTAAQAPLLAPQFEDYMKHRTGHGLGLDIHKGPSVMEGNHDPLVEGAVITVEPGLYLEGWGGVRIEDDLWVTAEGNDCLSSYPRALTVDRYAEEWEEMTHE